MPPLNKARRSRKAALQLATTTRRPPFSDKTNTVINFIESPNEGDTSRIKTHLYLDVCSSQYLILGAKMRNQLSIQWNDFSGEGAISFAGYYPKSSAENQEVGRAQNRAQMYKDNFFNSSKALNRSRQSVQDLKKTNDSLREDISKQNDLLSMGEHEVRSLRALCDWNREVFNAVHIRAIEHWNNFSAADKQRLMLLKRMSIESDRVSHLEASLEESRKINHRWRSRLAYARRRINDLQKMKNSITKFLGLTDKGAYSTAIRSLAFHLRQLGCSGKATGTAIDAFVQIVSGFLGPKGRKKKSPKKMSARTVGRIVTEGGVMSLIQMGFDLKKSESFTTGGDGTTHKHQNFEATNVNITKREESSNGDRPPPESFKHEIKFLKVEHTANHRAETQKTMLIESLQEAVDVFNRSPLGLACNTPGQILNDESMAMKYSGTHGDHAEDQKAKHRLLGEWKRELSMRGIGAQHFHSKTKEEQELLTKEARSTMTQ